MLSNEKDYLNIKIIKIVNNMQYIYTGCPTDMLTTSDYILKIEKSHMSKSKPCFEILGKKAFRWHLETCENQI